MSTFILVVFSFLCGFGDKTRVFCGGDYTDVHRNELQQAIGYWLDKDNLGRFTAREHDHSYTRGRTALDIARCFCRTLNCIPVLALEDC